MILKYICYSLKISEMKKIILSLILIMGITNINAQNLNTEMEKVSYSLGVNVAKSVKNQGLTSIDSRKRISQDPSSSNLPSSSIVIG